MSGVCEVQHASGCLCAALDGRRVTAFTATVWRGFGANIFFRGRDMYHVCALAAAKHLRSFVFSRLVRFWPSDWLDPVCVCVCCSRAKQKSRCISRESDYSCLACIQCCMQQLNSAKVVKNCGFCVFLGGKSAQRHNGTGYPAEPCTSRRGLVFF
jgi:hypothetical protein